MSAMIFENLLALARLPYFRREDDRLFVKDETIGPAIDMHSHLALAYVRPMQVDLYREHHETKHYLPGCCELDLDVYVNKNFRPEDLSELKKDLSLRSLTSGGMRETHTVPNLTREMGELRVERSAILPIDFPVLSENAQTALDVAKKDERLIGFGSVHPYARNMEKRLDEQLARGARGIKVHPAVQMVRPDNARAMKLYRLCGARGLPILWHCGPVGIEPALGRYLSQVRFYERPIADNPKTTFILGHSGALQMDQAVALTKKYPNVYLETSSQSATNIRTITEQADPNRIVFGSDWPFYHQAIAMAKVLLATEGDRALRHKILYANAARLLKLAD